MSFTKQSGKAESLRIGKAMPNEPSKLKTEQLALDFEEGRTFFCKACLEDRLLAEASLDGRYCRFCFVFLTEEAKRLPPGKRPKWIPKIDSRASEGLATRRSEDTPALGERRADE